MSIAAAITALNPNLWLKLDETSGTLAANSGSLSTQGTYSGSIQQGIAGPEQGTTALRLFSGGQVLTTAGMDVTTPAGYTIGAMLSTDASGVVNTMYPVITIGDPANRLARGPMLGEQHGTVNVPQFRGGWNPGGTMLMATPQPVLFWHWVVVSFITGTNGFKVYMDGTLVNTNTLSGTLPALTSDGLLIRCDEPMAIAHCCFWAGVLSQTQIQTVSNQITPWPPNQPINTAAAGGSGGGLTPDQATQLSDIHGWTNDIPGLVDASNFISSTVNTILGVVNTIHANVDSGFSQVTDFLNTIQSSVTATLTGVGGAIQQTLGQLFSGRTLDSLTGVISRDACAPSVILVEAGGATLYGLQMNCTSHPDWITFTGWSNDYAIQALAVLDIYRGGKLVARHGIHTLTYTVYPMPGITPQPWTLELPVTPGDYEVVLTPSPETCWHLDGLGYPG